MGGGQKDVAGLLTAVTSLLLLLAAAGKDCWREGARDRLASVGLSSRCRGLGGECVYDSMVNLRTCDGAVSYMETLPADLLAMRLCVLAMCALCCCSILLMLPGLSCIQTPLCSSPPPPLLLQLSGALCLSAGVCGVVGLLWYGVETYRQYTHEAALQTPGITFEFGPSYWLLVASVSCALTSAAVTLRSSSRRRGNAVRTQQEQPDVPATPRPASSYKTYI